MNKILLVKSILLTFASMGFASNSVYLLGIYDGSIPNPETDPILSLGIMILCLFGTLAGISLIANNNDNDNDNEDEG